MMECEICGSDIPYRMVENVVMFWGGVCAQLCPPCQSDVHRFIRDSEHFMRAMQLHAEAKCCYGPHGEVEDKARYQRIAAEVLEIEQSFWPVLRAKIVRRPSAISNEPQPKLED